MIKLKNLNFTHEMVIYEYSKWPSKGVPDESDTILNIIENVNFEFGVDDWPILVFCKY
jgi:hypothetical protein